MLKKLIDGEYGLGTLFWKFGILGLLVLNMITRVLHNILSEKIRGAGVVEYYTKYFRLFKSESSVIFWTALYLSSCFILISYAILILVGTWRASAEYDKSSYLSQIGRVLMLFLVCMSIWSNI